MERPPAFSYQQRPVVHFPQNRDTCTEFTLKRHKINHEVREIVCRGDVLEPECLAPCFDKEDWKKDRVPEDGRIIRDRSYEELKRERMKF